MFDFLTFGLVSGIGGYRRRSGGVSGARQIARVAFGWGMPGLPGYFSPNVIFY